MDPTYNQRKPTPTNTRQEQKPSLMQQTYGGQRQYVPPSFPAPAAPTENVPMDIDRTRTRPSPRRDTKEWIERLCFYCKQPGHLAKNCPILANRGTAQRSTCFEVVDDRSEAGKEREENLIDLGFVKGQK